jgi:hypothetical protein
MLFVGEASIVSFIERFPGRLRRSGICHSWKTIDPFSHRIDGVCVHHIAGEKSAAEKSLVQPVRLSRVQNDRYKHHGQTNQTPPSADTQQHAWNITGECRL